MEMSLSTDICKNMWTSFRNAPDEFKSKCFESYNLDKLIP